MFGWGAFGAVALIGGLGGLLIWLAQETGRTVPWRIVISLEFAFIALLGALHAFGPADGWQTMKNGEGGGVFGWALLTMVAPLMGRAWAGVIFAAVMVLSVTIAFAIPWLVWTRSRCGANPRTRKRVDRADCPIGRGKSIGG